MKTLYLECVMGAAGDMLMAALLELHPDPTAFLARMNALGLPGVQVSCAPAEKCGILGSHITVTVNGIEEVSADAHHHHHDHGHDHGHEHHHDHTHHHEQTHHHTSVADIRHILMEHLALPEAVRADAMAVYDLIAEAESHAHGKPVDQIHFHEVGTMDAVADVVGVCLLIHELGLEKIVASPVHVGSGHVHCAHGILPVPAPATAHILRDVPICSGEIEGELCTPTGAALLKHFVSDFGPMPVMRVEKIGYGMGTRDFPRANCVRAMLGETADSGDTVLELQCNLDDMPGEDIGFAMDALLSAGALDVYTAPIQMKKNRPGVLLSCLCRPEDRDTMVSLIFRHTTTLGIRETEHRRNTLTRRTEIRETAFGPIPYKISSGYGVTRSKPEYDTLKQLAQDNNLSLSQLRDKI